MITTLLAATLTLLPGDRITGKPFATRSEVIARHGMAATSIPLASLAAIDTLKAGGSAVDAAIAANAVQALLEPTGCGLGGDLYAIVWDPKERKLAGYNGSGRSPATLTAEEFARRGLKRIPALGPLPVSVPGCVDGWFALHARFGKLPMAQVLAPAIAHAREGAPVTELVAYYWGRSANTLKQFPGFAETFLPGGRAPQKGDVFSNPRLANTLELLAKEGRDAFYQGRVAREIETYMKAQGGFLTAEDMAAHTGEWIAPVSLNYRGYDVWELPPNGQGIAALQMLGILEGYDMAAAGFGSTQHVHRFVEAKKLAFEDRAALYADLDAMTVKVDDLISERYAAERRKLIGERAARSFPVGNPAADEGDTIYLTTADSSGMMVSLIQSNYRGMGSGMTPGELGFILQDRGELFDLTPGRANSYAPRKRPFHTIIPAFVTKDGEPYLSFGVMGGATQPQGHVQIVLNLIDFQMNLQEAGDAPRILHDGSSEPTGERMSDGGRVFLESGYPQETLRELVQRGHSVGTNVGDFGGYQAILWDRARGVYIGASESRKDGCAIGY
ncbi:MAG: gamma-glutamyltransferase [Planctomycetaceae bacterium]|nr:gamma-glutamyltransferase [Planctomycetaceae bacterium]